MRIHKKGVNVIITNNQGKILILKRSSMESHYSNLWDLPGGEVKAAESLQEAVQRETKEETGLQTKPKESHFYIYRYQNKNLDIYGFRTNLISGKVVLSKEHVEFKWVSKDEWKNFDYTPSVKATIKEFFKSC